MNRLRLFLLAVLVLPAAAAAQNPEGIDARLEPNTPSAASRLAGRTPSAVVLSVQRGFRVDPRAAAGRCTPQQAEELACPDDSRVGAGTAVVTAKSLLLPGGMQDYEATLGFFLGAPRRDGDLAAVVVTVREPKTNVRETLTGRLVAVADGAFAYEIRFEGPQRATMALPPGVTVELKRLRVEIGAQRTVTTTRRVRRKGRVLRVKRRTVLALVTNPSRCSGTWSGRLRTAFADGGEESFALSVPCRTR